MSASTPNLIKQVNLQCVRSALLELKSATNFMWDRVLTLLEEARRED